MSALLRAAGLALALALVLTLNAPASHGAPAQEQAVVTSIRQYNALQKTRAFDTPMLLEAQGELNTWLNFEVQLAQALGSKRPLAASSIWTS